MSTIKDILTKYHQKIDYLDLELLIAHELKKSREFVLAHPEHVLTTNQKLQTTNLIKRRRRGEPLAYILEHKEFFGLDFKVNQHTLVPRPETELLVELALLELPASTRGNGRSSTRGGQTTNHKLLTSVIDVGTGSGNIIVSLACNMKHGTHNKINLFGTDISSEALKVAKQNAKLHKVDKKIKFLRGDLLDPILKTTNYKLNLAYRQAGTTNLLILANLPYLSKEIYAATAPTVKKYEPKSALYSAQVGLAHYAKLLKQIKELTTNHQLRTTNFLEISPEQKLPLTKLIKLSFPQAKIDFFRDLAGRWRICKISR
ncbi:MAG: peptide chain release factor N(5)-glutamine methyltransferase [Parcubacteria group bacterium]|jgi:release factor glutamine methyltransferase